MRPFVFGAGEKFGRLTVVCVDAANSARPGGRRWMCRCDCGRNKSVSASALKHGYIRSCGCLHDELVAERGRANATHRMVNTPTYRSWTSMKNRCMNPRNRAWKSYGGRGITVCARWMSFEAFRADMGDRPDGTTIDRVENDGNYEPGNCRWATAAVQKLNMRNSLRLRDIDDNPISLAAFANIIAMEPTSLAYRLRRAGAL